MKTILIILSFLTVLNLNAQGAYEKGMAKAFELWQTNKSDEATNLFERIGKAEKENWLPYYYAAQIHVTKSFNTKDATAIESRLKKAQDFINQAKTYSKDNAEILILEAMLNTAYVVYKPSVYGMTLSPKIEALYTKAKKLEPKNPRAVLYHADWQMGGAKFWGKDPKAYCSEIEKAITLFEIAPNQTPFYPSWGKDQVARIQKNCE